MIPESAPNHSELWGNEMSPSVRLLRNRYKRLGLDRWNNKRVLSVMRAYKITLMELCAFAGAFEKKVITRCWTLNKWPMHLTLHFAILETMWAKEKGLRTELIRDEACLAALFKNVTTKKTNA